MDQTNKARPSLPSISSLIEAVTEQQFEKGTSPPILKPLRYLPFTNIRQELPRLLHSILYGGFQEARMAME